MIIPSERMKAGKEHRVPLSKQAQSILSQLSAFKGTSKFVFHGQRPDRHLSSSAMEMMMRRMNFSGPTPCTVFGRAFGTGWWL